MDTMEKISPLHNEIEAQLLGAELKSRGVPHAIVSHYDLAYDGLFQFFQGWGHVEAPVEFRAEILTILEDLRPLDSDSDEEASPPGDPT